MKNKHMLKTLVLGLVVVLMIMGTIVIEQNRCAMAYQGCGAVFIFSTIIKKGNGNSF